MQKSKSSVDSVLRAWQLEIHCHQPAFKEGALPSDSCPTTSWKEIYEDFAEGGRDQLNIESMVGVDGFGRCKQSVEVLFEFRTACEFAVIYKASEILQLVCNEFSEKFAEFSYLPPDKLNDIGGILIEKSRITFMQYVGTLACMYAVGFLRLSSEGLFVYAKDFDSEYLKSWLFGFRSSFRNLDSLFGGHGPILSDGRSPGRVMLVKGDIGAGKSTFGIGLAVDVLERGGVAWLATFEQNEDECLHLAKTLKPGISWSDEDIVVNTMSALKKIKRSDQALFVILKTTQRSLTEGLEDIADGFQFIGNNNIKLAIVDPLNSIFATATSREGERRAMFHSALVNLRKVGVNVILVCEDDRSEEPLVLEAEKLSDVVVSLTRDSKQTGYNQRYLEISKSRMQREQRGKHPFAMKGASGIEIYPSTAAIAARLENRGALRRKKPTKFGWSELDDNLSNDGVAIGDLILIVGPEGALKSHLAAVFAHGFDRATEILEWNDDADPKGNQREGKQKDDYVTLFLTVKDTKSSVGELLKDASVLACICRRLQGKQIRICELPAGGYVQPGALLARIEEQLEIVRKERRIVDRIVLENVGLWEVHCPYLSMDMTFPFTLVQLFKKYTATVLITCHPSSESSSGINLQSSLVESADVVMKSEHVEFRGSLRRMFRVLKTRKMNHDTRFFELSKDQKKLHLSSRASLLKIDKEGNLSSILSQLYLHEEGPIQCKYNSVLEKSFAPIYGSQLRVNSRDRTYLVDTLRLSSSATVDELQIIQLDEFQYAEQLANVDNECLSSLRSPAFNPEIFRAGYLSRRGKEMFAVPYIDNLGLLALNLDLCRSSMGELNGRNILWEDLYQAAIRFRDKKMEGVFFDFPCKRNETYICLFLEIALGVGVRGPHRGEEARAWLERQDWKRLMKAFMVFNELGFDSHRLHPNENEFRDDVHVWRHWFTTLSDMLEIVNDGFRRKLLITTLPKNIGVAGEWYLGIPKYSAAQSDAQNLLETMCSEEEQFERMRLGVGLPVNARFYDYVQGDQELVFKWFKLSKKDVRECLENSLRRSLLKNYRSIARPLAYHLKHILEIDPPRDSAGKRSLEMAVRRLTEAVS